jgi:broad specificity phosphatase PhoE
VTVDERWAEIDYGIYDGMALADVPADVWAHFRTDPHWTPEGGESLAHLAARVKAACEELWPEALEDDVIVVSHVSPIKAAITWALGTPSDSAWRMFVDVASVSRIDAGPEGGPSLRSFNEVHHRPSD